MEVTYFKNSVTGYLRGLFHDSNASRLLSGATPSQALSNSIYTQLIDNTSEYTYFPWLKCLNTNISLTGTVFWCKAAEGENGVVREETREKMFERIKRIK